MEIEVREKVALRRVWTETRTGRRWLKKYTVLRRKKNESHEEFLARIKDTYPQAEIIEENT